MVKVLLVKYLLVEYSVTFVSNAIFNYLIPLGIGACSATNATNNGPCTGTSFCSFTVSRYGSKCATDGCTLKRGGRTSALNLLRYIVAFIQVALILTHFHTFWINNDIGMKREGD